jgi:hypothetical protein
MTMLTDGIKSKNLEDRIKQMDIVELLDRSCEEVQVPAPVGEPPAPLPPPTDPVEAPPPAAADAGAE